VLPEHDGARLVFQEIDVARARLIRDLRTQMALPDDSIPVVLSLVDQVYELRGRLRSVVEAVQGQPAEIRRSILGALGGAER
jgi:chaperone modulatory protein CbpM